MNVKPLKGWLKHADFIILDMLGLQLSYVIVYWLISGFGNPYRVMSYRYLAVVFLFSQLIASMFTSNYSGILRRGYLREFISVFYYELSIMLISLAFLFAVKQTSTISRLQYGNTLLLFFVVCFGIRTAHKKFLTRIRKNKNVRSGRSTVVITSGALVDEAYRRLVDNTMPAGYFIAGFILIDGDRETVKGDYDVPIVTLDEKALKRLQNKWVDEVLILQPDDIPMDKELINRITDMGITVNFTMAAFNEDDMPPMHQAKIGTYNVLSASLKFITAGQAAIKRVADILGSIVGCIITGILFIFVAPAIYIKSPGPIFFTQDRVGRGGKVFKMYKFRSMYLDAEERKAELLKYNKIDSNYIFKMDDDPRIIGSEKKDRKGRPCGIGNFIRRTSIDEFPQFFNVLKGDMSLVGTRPPTVQEFELYDEHHRARMTVKPGITGLWQVSGRSQITDFEEIVKLDKMYVENWSFYLDFKILLKTVAVVLLGRGAE